MVGRRRGPAEEQIPQLVAQLPPLDGRDERLARIVDLARERVDAVDAVLDDVPGLRIRR